MKRIFFIFLCLVLFGFVYVKAIPVAAQGELGPCLNNNSSRFLLSICQALPAGDSLSDCHNVDKCSEEPSGEYTIKCVPSGNAAKFIKLCKPKAAAPETPTFNGNEHIFVDNRSCTPGPFLPTAVGDKPKQQVTVTLNMHVSDQLGKAVGSRSYIKVTAAGQTKNATLGNSNSTSVSFSLNSGGSTNFKLEAVSEKKLRATDPTISYVLSSKDFFMPLDDSTCGTSGAAPAQQAAPPAGQTSSGSTTTLGTPPAFTTDNACKGAGFIGDYLKNCTDSISECVNSRASSLSLSHEADFAETNFQNCVLNKRNLVISQIVAAGQPGQTTGGTSPGGQSNKPAFDKLKDKAGSVPRGDS